MERRRFGLYVDPTARIAIANVAIGEKRAICTAQVKLKTAVDTSTTAPKGDITRLREKIQVLKVSRQRGEIGRWEFERQRRSLHNLIINLEGGE